MFMISGDSESFVQKSGGKGFSPTLEMRMTKRVSMEDNVTGGSDPKFLTRQVVRVVLPQG